MNHGGLFVGPCGVELVEGVLEFVGFEGLAVGLAEHLHLFLEAGSHASSGDSSHGGCGGGVGVDKWCPVPWTWEVRECDSACVLSMCRRGTIPRARITVSRRNFTREVGP